MKLVILVDSTAKNFKRMINLVNKKDVTIINTERCDEQREYKYLLDAINEFSRSNNEIMLGKFSGRENIVRELGDERSEMILSLSSNRNSRNYTNELVDMFSKIIDTFEKETTSTKNIIH